MDKLEKNYDYDYREYDIRANVDKLDLSSYVCGFNCLTVITHAPSTELILPQLENDRKKKLINKPSISCLKCNIIQLEGNILISDLCLLLDKHHYWNSIERINIPMLKNIYIDYTDKHKSNTRMRKIDNNSRYGNSSYNEIYLGETKCPVYLLESEKDKQMIRICSLHSAKYEPEVSNVETQKQKKKINTKLPRLNGRDYKDDLDYDEYLDHSEDYEDNDDSSIDDDDYSSDSYDI